MFAIKSSKFTLAFYMLQNLQEIPQHSSVETVSQNTLNTAQQNQEQLPTLAAGVGLAISRMGSVYCR